MAKPLKIVAFVVSGLLLLLIAALVAATLLFDPNDHRDRIAAAVKEKTGRELTLGHIELKIFPWLNVAIENAGLSNAPGFAPAALAEARQVSAGIRLLPLLLHRQIEVSTVTLDGVRVHLAKDASGQSNWADLLKQAPEQEPGPAPQPTTESQFDPASIDIAGVTIRDTSVVYSNAQTGERYELSQLKLKTGALAPDAPVDIDLAVRVLSKRPEAKADIEFSGTVIPDLAHKTLSTKDLQLTVNGLRATLAKDRNGQANWAHLLNKNEEKKAQEPKDAEPFDLKRIDIAGITINDAGLIYSDAQSGAHYELSKLKLKTGAFKPGEPCDIELASQIAAKAPAARLDVGFSGKLKPDFKSNKLDTENLRLTLKGKAKDLDIASNLRTRLVADLGGKIYNLQNLAIETELAGAQVPSGRQTVKLLGTVAYNGAQGALRVSDATLTAADLVLKTTLTGSGLNSETPQLRAPLAISTFSPRKLAETFGIKLNSADPKAFSTASLNAQYSGDFKSARFSQLAMTLDQTAIKGSFAIDDFKTQAIQFALNLDAIDADRYLAPKTTAEKPKSGGSPTAALNQVKLPDEALTKLNANGTFDIGKLKINKLSLSDIRLKVAGKAGAAKEQNLSAQLYGGSIRLTHRFTPGATPGYALATQLRSFQAAPFLKDLLGKDYVSGTADLTLDVSGRGQTVAELRRTLNGTVSALAKDGAVKGFNLGRIIRRGEAALSGNLAQQPATTEQTDFSTISVSGVIANGVLRSDDLNGASPLLRVTGSGEIDLANETINYVAKPTIVETSKGQGGKELAQLDGVTIPVRVTGNLFKPKYKLDVQQAVQQKAAEKIREQVKGKETELKEKLNEKIGDLLFGKKRKPATAPSESAAEPAAPEASTSEPAPAPEPAPTESSEPPAP